MDLAVPDMAERFEAVRPRLVAFARLQLEDEALAEDKVQDTLLAAYESIERFSGQSKFETWLFAILKNKLIDEIRRRKREFTTDFDADQVAEVDDMFDERAHWVSGQQPQKWVQPESSYLHDQFWQVFDVCVFHLPKGTARVFTMRELLGIETDEICDSLGLSQQNVWTMLHRARLKIRGCLERGWYGREEIEL